MSGHPDLVSAIRTSVERHGDDRWYAFVRRERAGAVEDRHSFAELDARARSIAAWLLDRGLRDRTALLLYPAGPEFLAAFLGCLYARVVAVPAPLPEEDPRGLERLTGIVKDAGPALILTDAGHREALGPYLDRVATDTLALPHADDWRRPDLRTETVAFLQYTSGSTSEPKGVVLTHGNLLHNEHAAWTQLGRPGTGTLAGWLPHYHDMGLIGLLLQPLYGGLNLAFTAPATFLRRPVTWLELISHYRAEITVAPNFGYDWCARKTTDEQLAGLDLGSLRIAMNGAEPVRPATLRRVAERLGPAGFRPRAWMPVYGMAEATLIVSGARRHRGATVGTFDTGALQRHRAVPADAGTELVSCGAPLDAELRIVDPATRTELADGAVGEVWLRSGSVAAGYWRQPDESAATFGARTAAGDGPFLRTGDLGFRRDGELYVTGRLKDVIILNGRNIHPEDLEEAARLHPALGVAAAFTHGDDREHVVLIQEVRTPEADRLPELAERVQAELAGGFGIPAPAVLLVGRGTIARTTSGKIRRGHMRERFLGGRLDPLHTLAGA